MAVPRGIVRWLLWRLECPSKPLSLRVSVAKAYTCRVSVQVGE